MHLFGNCMINVIPAIYFWFASEVVSNSFLRKGLQSGQIFLSLEMISLDYLGLVLNIYILVGPIYVFNNAQN